MPTSTGTLKTIRNWNSAAFKFFSTNGENQMRFVTKTIHAYLDYPVAASLIVMPFLLQLGSSHSIAKWLSVGTGVAALLLTLFTNHKLGVFRVLPYRMHLGVDFLVGIVFALAPFALGFHGIDAFYYWFNAAAVLTVVSLHKPEVIPQAAMA